MVMESLRSWWYKDCIAATSEKCLLPVFAFSWRHDTSSALSQGTLKLTVSFTALLCTSKETMNANDRCLSYKTSHWYQDDNSHLSSLLRDTNASTMPLTTHGKEFKGAMSTLKSAKDVKTMVAFSSWPSRTNKPNVNSDIRIGVVAQR